MFINETLLFESYNAVTFENSGLISFFSGNRNLKKGKNARKINPTLNAVNRSGGIVLMPNFPTG